MANEEHLALLRQGVEAWNEWKANNPDIRPNLSFATGSGIIIREAKLSGVDLSRADLSRADLSRADLIGSNLSEAHLKEAYLSEADLIGANLCEAYLGGADLIGSNLIGANLTEAYLSGADLSKANLSGADLVGAKLIGAKLSGTNLSGAKLSGANLSGAYLKEANFKGANLKDANLTGANLTGANLQRTKALDTNFSKATLTGACLEDWHTNSTTNLEDVICDYVYLGAEQRKRTPTQGKFAPGEFTKLFQKALETIDFIFQNGIDWRAFFVAFQKLQVESSTLGLSLQSLENKTNGAFIIRINLNPEVNKENIENYLRQEYESALKLIDKEYRYQLQASYEQIALYRQQCADLTEIVRVMAMKPINVEIKALIEDKTVSDVSRNAQPDSNLAHLASPVHFSNSQLSIQYDYTSKQNKNLRETAARIQKLLQQLEQNYPTSTPLEKQMVVLEVVKKIESNLALKQWIVQIINEFNIQDLKRLIDHPLVNVLMAALEGYLEVD
ncbi:MAG: pentapeptide repeat-containing protein [Microcoleus sp. SIO2G3]|nr:pentapeptide repeat-containing protein [Microcoleus sp. SIO2G3]